MTRESATRMSKTTRAMLRWVGVGVFALSLTVSATSARAANLYATVDISGNLISGSGATGSIYFGARPV